VPENPTQPQPVVSDTSPLISLVVVGLLHLLGDLYGEVLVPELVRDEYEAGRLPSEPSLHDLGWVSVVPVLRDPALPAALDAGEAAALSLALTTGARAVLLDERLGRRVATQRGLPIVGTLGVVLRAKQAGLVPAVRPVVDEMIARGIRISPALRAVALRDAGEGE
jgi:predicted nucleic acid-binding protein